MTANGARKRGHCRASPVTFDALVASTPIARPFATRLLRWFRRHGRKDLPWQTDKTPYRVWVSEVMLQQTQARSVIPYFLRFMRRFPTVRDLAASEPDDILSLWSGLGYYARAHNLRRAAMIVCERYDGVVPDTHDALLALPGIGRSTAGAILALCHGRREPILDGNVKRVLARHRGVQGWAGRTDVAKQLWEWSRHLLPARRDSMANYTQALMDLGATVCVRTRPQCPQCPLAEDCHARLNDCVTTLPTPRPKTRRPLRHATMVLATWRGHVLMARRPDVGLWAGLLCLPEVDDDDARAWCRRALGVNLRPEQEATPWPEMNHDFTHFRLRIKPKAVHLAAAPNCCGEASGLVWCKIEDGLKQAPAPVKKLLHRLAQSERERKRA